LVLGGTCWCLLILVGIPGLTSPTPTPLSPSLPLSPPHSPLTPPSLFIPDTPTCAAPSDNTPPWCTVAARNVRARDPAVAAAAAVASAAVGTFRCAKKVPPSPPSPATKWKSQANTKPTWNRPRRSTLPCRPWTPITKSSTARGERREGWISTEGTDTRDSLSNTLSLFTLLSLSLHCSLSLSSLFSLSLHCSLSLFTVLSLSLALSPSLSLPLSPRFPLSSG
jgi:hypothetical protein